MGKGKDEEKIKAEIKCQYVISPSEKKVNILGKDFDKGNNIIDILINGAKIEFNKEYDFPNSGTNEVIFQIYSDLNMTNMFKEVKTLTSINLESNVNLKITSMQSAFENSENLKQFTISGFNLENLKSASHCFWHTSINNPKLDIF